MFVPYIFQSSLWSFLPRRLVHSAPSQDRLRDVPGHPDLDGGRLDRDELASHPVPEGVAGEDRPAQV